jgi:hypothetical protein
MKGSMIVWKSGTGIGVSLSFCLDRLGRLHVAAAVGLGARFYQADLSVTAGDF